MYSGFASLFPAEEEKGEENYRCGGDKKGSHFSSSSPFFYFSTARQMTFLDFAAIHGVAMIQVGGTLAAPTSGGPRPLHLYPFFSSSVLSELHAEAGNGTWLRPGAGALNLWSRSDGGWRRPKESISNDSVINKQKAFVYWEHDGLFPVPLEPLRFLLHQPL